MYWILLLLILIDTILFDRNEEDLPLKGRFFLVPHNCSDSCHEVCEVNDHSHKGSI